MAPEVVVKALRAFEYRGRSITPGQHVSMATMDAALLAYQGFVSRSKVVNPVIAVPEAEPEPAPRRRRYRRRDMVAEG